MNIPMFIKNKSIYKKLLFSFTITITILIIIMSSFLYNFYAKSSYKKMDDFNSKILSQISYSATYMDNLAKNYCGAIFLDNGVIPLLYRDTIDYYSMGNSLRTLEKQTVANTYINSIYIYNNSLNLYMSTQTNGFYSTEDFYDQEANTLLNSIKEKNIKLIPIPRKIPVSELTSGIYDYHYVYSYLIYNTPTKNSTLDGAIMLNINADYLTETIVSLESQTHDYDSDIFVINEDGIIVNHSSPEMFLEDASDKKYIKKILESKKDTGVFTETIDNKKYVVTYVSSDMLKWKFVSLTPYRFVVSTIEEVKWTTLIFCLIVLLLGLIFSIIMSRSIYSPINILINNIEKKTKLNKNNDIANEVKFLNTVFNQIMSKTKELERKNKHNIKSQKNKLLKDLSTSEFNYSDKLLNRLKELNINLDFNKPLFPVLLKIDNYTDFMEQYNAQDRTLYKFAIINIIDETIPKDYNFEVIDMENNYICILLNISTSPIMEDELYAKIEKVALNMQNNIKTYLNISLTATLGYLIDKPNLIPTVLNDTKLLSMYRILYGHGSIITPVILNDINTDDFAFPSNQEKMLLDSLKLCNLEKAKKAYLKIMSVISNYSYNNIMTCIMYMVFTIYTNVNNDKKSNAIKLTTAFEEFLNKIGTFESLDEINEVFFKLFEEIINTLNKSQSSNNRTESIVKNVITIIEDSFSDKTLCLNIIADSLSMSSVYLGKLFKEAVGKSIAEYILDTRMNNVKNLLDTTNLSTKVILEKSGFEQSNYFYTLFKKYYGVTLSNYRLMICENQLNTADKN
ncbi:helix-turn-helix domain-containing protein [Vallitalea guaymasensis]|uniref:helix-turn-helix domain-containing protein n=1 Tax=Vallitalea guaymasensis TaxID=1185412 RepID=UPI00272B3510|nr:AraC family transcriptional regulator [Vallitalea guaymasensis]